jgi:hypothetical protein
MWRDRRVADLERAAYHESGATCILAAAETDEVALSCHDVSGQVLDDEYSRVKCDAIFPWLPNHSGTRAAWSPVVVND